MEVKVVGSNKQAKELLRLGYKIIDIKPHKDDYKRTVFVFECNEAFIKDFERTLEV